MKNTKQEPRGAALPRSLQLGLSTGFTREEGTLRPPSFPSPISSLLFCQGLRNGLHRATLVKGFGSESVVFTWFPYSVLS